MKKVFGLAFALACSAFAASAAENPATLINGTIVARDEVVAGGWLAIRDGKILSISAAKPDLPGARTLVTRDIVFPGFVDLHNHPVYGIFPRWKPPQVYASRYKWRGDTGYLTTIQNPEGKLILTHFCDMDAYVELQQLTGGTTSMLGVFMPADTPKIEPCIYGLARNLDWASGFHGTPLGQERLGNVLGVHPNDVKLSQPTLDEFHKGNLDLIAVHLAEGQRKDAESQAEFAMLEQQQLLGPKTAIVHGVALTEAEFAKMKAAGTAFVWSPRSNFELYGETADVPAAVRQKVAIALAPDWPPTGSPNMLGEVGYAKKVADRDFPGLFSTRQLFEMATLVPARIGKIDDKVGSLAPGLYADLFLLRGDAAHPYDALAAAKPGDVTLTMVGGVPIYGDKSDLAALGVTATEAIAACGDQRAVNSQAISSGSLAGVTSRLTAALAAENLKLNGIVECP